MKRLVGFFSANIRHNVFLQRANEPGREYLAVSLMEAIQIVGKHRYILSSLDSSGSTSTIKSSFC